MLIWSSVSSTVIIVKYRYLWDILSCRQWVKQYTTELYCDCDYYDCYLFYPGKHFVWTMVEMGKEREREGGKEEGRKGEAERGRARICRCKELWFIN